MTDVESVYGHSDIKPPSAATIRLALELQHRNSSLPLTPEEIEASELTEAYFQERLAEVERERDKIIAVLRSDGTAKANDIADALEANNKGEK